MVPTCAAIERVIAGEPRQHVAVNRAREGVVESRACEIFKSGDSV